MSVIIMILEIPSFLVHSYVSVSYNESSPVFVALFGEVLKNHDFLLVLIIQVTSGDHLPLEFPQCDT